MSSLRVAVIVCAYTTDRLDDMDRAIKSVQDQSRPADQLLLVIDHHESLLNTCQGRYPGVTVLPNRSVKGLSGARNSGLAEVHSEVVLFLDDDAVAHRDWISEMVMPLERDPTIDIVGGRTLPAWDLHRPRWFPAEFDWVIGATYRGIPEKVHEVRNPFGGNAGWRMTVFDRVGGFATHIGRVGADAAGCEETELAIRYRRANPRARIVYLPSAVISHRVRSERATLRYFLARCRAEGRSKAVVAELVGQDAVTRESAYAVHVLAPAVAADVTATLTGRDPAGLARAMVMMTGLAVTATSYLRARVSRRGRRARPWVMEPAA